MLEISPDQQQEGWYSQRGNKCDTAGIEPANQLHLF